MKDCNNRAVDMQALEKQDEQIEELETSATEMQQELANANVNLEQQASTMKKVRQLKHLSNVETRFYCPQAFLSLHFWCTDDISEFNQRIELKPELCILPEYIMPKVTHRAHCTNMWGESF